MILLIHIEFSIRVVRGLSPPLLELDWVLLQLARFDRKLTSH